MSLLCYQLYRLTFCSRTINWQLFYFVSLFDLIFFLQTPKTINLESRPSDVSFLFNGTFAPLSCKIVEQVMCVFLLRNKQNS